LHLLRKKRDKGKSGRLNPRLCVQRKKKGDPRKPSFFTKNDVKGGQSETRVGGKKDPYAAFANRGRGLGAEKWWTETRAGAGQGKKKRSGDEKGGKLSKG